MDKIITPNFEPNVFCYFDHIIVVAKNLEEHLKDLEMVLDKINEAKLIIMILSRNLN